MIQFVSTDENGNEVVWSSNEYRKRFPVEYAKWKDSRPRQKKKENQNPIFGPWSTKEQVKEWKENMFISPEMPDSNSMAWIEEQGMEFMENYIRSECGEPLNRTCKQWRRVFVILTNGKNLASRNKIGFFSVDRSVKGALLTRYRKDYYKSKAWKEVRELKFEEVGRECEKCGVTENLHIHHEEYKTLGREKLSDLQVLCRKCHNIEHTDSRNY